MALIPLLLTILCQVFVLWNLLHTKRIHRKIKEDFRATDLRWRIEMVDQLRQSDLFTEEWLRDAFGFGCSTCLDKGTIEGLGGREVSCDCKMPMPKS